MHCLALSSSKQRPEQMPVDRDEQGGAEPAALAGTGAPAAAPGGRWALGTGAAKKCQGLHPGNSHSHAWRCGSPPAEGNAGKIAGKEGAEYSMEANLPGSSARCGARTPPLRRGFSSQTGFVSSRLTERKNRPAASQIWNPAFYPWDKCNHDCSGVLECCREAREIRM